MFLSKNLTKCVRIIITLSCAALLVSCVGSTSLNSSGNKLNSALGNGNRSVYVALGAYGVMSYSYDNTNWSLIGVPAVAYNSMVTDENNHVVAVGENGSVIFSADDGATWSGVKSGLTESLNKVAYGNGVFIAVGNNGFISRSNSIDKWSASNIGYTGNLTGISYTKSSNVGIWVVTTDNNKVFYSYNNGATWNSTDLGTGVILNNIKYAKNEFYAVGSNGNIWHSVDGSAWVQSVIYSDSKQISKYSGNITSITYGNNLFLGTTSDGKLISSNDGQVWVLLGALSLKSLNNIYYNNNTFVVVGDNFVRASSDNGKTWREILTTTYNFKDAILTQDSNSYIFTAQKGYIVRTSNTFSNAKVVPILGSSLNSAQHSADGSLIITVGNDGTIISSTNGQAWTKQQSNTIYSLKKIMTLGSNFIAVGLNGTIVQSSNGVNWKSSQPFSSLQFFDGANDSNSEIIAIGRNGSTTSTKPAAILSNDAGKTWSDISTKFESAGDLRAITYNKDNKTFLVTDSLHQIFTSSDGNKWSKIGSFTGLINGLSYAYGTYVAVGDNGVIVTSTNGKDWLACGSNDLKGYSFYGVGSSNVNNQFIATGTNGSLVKITTNGANASCALNNIDSDVTIFDYDSISQLDKLNVVSTIPSNNTNNVAQNSTIRIAFDDSINTSTLTNDSVQLASGGNVVTASLNIDNADGNNDVLVITPSQPLAPNTNYTVSINQKLLNTYGNSLASDYSFNFTTAAAVPVVTTLAYPANNSALPFDSKRIVLQFDTPMNESSFNSNTISVNGALGAQTLSYDKSSNQLTVFYSGDSSGSSFTAGSSLSVTVNNAKSILGNSVSKTLSFTTAAVPQKWTYLTSLESNVVKDNVGASFIDSNESSLYVAYLSKQTLVLKKLNTDLKTWSSAGSIAVDSTYSYFPKFAIASNGVQYFAYVNASKSSANLISCQNNACKLAATYTLSKNGNNIGALDLVVNPVTKLPAIAVAYGPGNNNSYTNQNNKVDILYYNGSTLSQLAKVEDYAVSRKSVNIAADATGGLYLAEISDGKSNSVNVRVMRLNYASNNFATEWQKASVLTLPVASLKGGNLSSLTNLKVSANKLITFALVNNNNAMSFYNYNWASSDDDKVNSALCSNVWMNITTSQVLNYTGTTDFSLLYNTTNQLYSSLISLSTQSATQNQILSGSVYGVSAAQWLGQQEFSVGTNYLDVTQYNNSYYAITSEVSGTNSYYYTVYRY